MIVAVATRICSSATAGQLVMWLLVVSCAAPFAVYAVRASRRDIKKALILGVAILLVVGVLVGTANAFPMLDPCDTCRRAALPTWLCWLQGCF